MEIKEEVKVKKKKKKSTIKKIGRVFTTCKLESNSMELNKYAVCECSCGYIFVSRIVKKKPRVRVCKYCSGNENLIPAWESVLRERIIRSQNWFKDRNGKIKCNFCGKGRHDKFANYCRQCESEIARSKIIIQSEEKITFCNVFKHEPENNVFHDAVKVLEDSKFACRD